MADVFDYSTMNSAAKRLIDKFGVVLLITKSHDSAQWTELYNSVGGYNYWKNKASGATTTTKPVVTETSKAVITKYTVDEISTASPLILASDKRLLTYGIDEPSVGDIYTINLKKYQYVSHDSVEPAGSSIIYKIQVRV